MGSLSNVSGVIGGGVHETFVKVSALSSGSLTLPEHLFVQPSVSGKRNTVPSLSFLILHREPSTGKMTRILFDLGLRRNLAEYPTPLQQHLVTREPLCTSPDVKASVEGGGLSLEEIDIVILSHVHWDHVGTPSDFTKSHFVVGYGALELLRSGADPSTTGGHSHFEPDLLPKDRTTELSQPSTGRKSAAGETNPKKNIVVGLSQSIWQPLAYFPNVIDVFSDGSLFIVDAPGHLQGHLNILAKIGSNKWVYLAGDACHDRRLLSKELEIAEWRGDHGQMCCIHVDRDEAAETIERIRILEDSMGEHVEVVLAHDATWIEVEENKKRFWPGSM